MILGAMLLTIVLGLSVCTLGVVLRIYPKILKQFSRKSSIKALSSQPGSSNIKTTFTRISASPSPGVNLQSSRSALNQTMEIRRCISARLPEGTNPRSSSENQSANNVVDTYNYFPKGPLVNIPSPSIPYRHSPALALDHVGTSPHMPGVFSPSTFNDTPPFQSPAKSDIQTSLPYALRPEPSLAMGKRRKHLPPQSASDNFKKRRSLMAGSHLKKRHVRSSENTPTQPGSDNKRVRTVHETTSEDNLPQPHSERDGPAHIGIGANDEDMERVDVENELTIEFPEPEELEASSIDVQSYDDDSKIGGAMSDVPEPELPHSDLFKSHRRISRMHPRRRPDLDDMLFDDDEIRLKFQRNDKEVLQILQSYDAKHKAVIDNTVSHKRIP